ncbi:MAG: single-stranded-DNA-specific exonuclease RecJ [Thermodesulfobacteriota bacterium]
MKSNWNITQPNEDLQREFVKEFNILPLTAQFLINRGFVELGTASSFLNPDIKAISEPSLMSGMEESVQRIAKALKDREKIAIYGDYDVDGTTATALLKLFFKELGTSVLTHIPERLSEGYALNNNAIKSLNEAGASLIITTDCGVSNHDEIVFANTIGVDIIITDHHEVPERVPPAYAILNPHKKGCEFPFKGLSGVGVAFYLAMGLRQKLRDDGYFTDREEPNLKKYLDLVCIGTVADMVPLVDENRILVKHGLTELKRTERPGLKALKSVAGVRDEKLNTESISFQLAPRINAAGRVGSASVALELLCTTDEIRARYLALKLDDENKKRQKIEADIYEEALAMIEKNSTDKGIVLFKEGWHPGVVGIVASRLVSRFSKPAIMIALDGELGRGSARGIKNFDILNGISKCSDLLIKFGGHRAAAGLTVSQDNTAAFRDKFMSFINESLSDEDLIPEVQLDGIISLDEIDMRLVNEIEKLSPFGISNREPLLGALDTNILHTSVVGAKHLKLMVRHKGDPLKAIAFGLGDMHPITGPGFDLAFRPYLDDWRGGRSLGLKIKDVKETLV